MRVRDLLYFAPGIRFDRTEDLAQRFYDEFRNGLVHEARLKEGAQFTLEVESTVKDVQGLLLINPTLLSGEVRSALDHP